MRIVVAVLAAVAVAVATVVVVSTTSGDPLPDEIASDVVAVRLGPDPANVLRGVLEVTTASAARVVVTLRAEDHELVVTEDEPAEQRTVPVLGVRPEREYEVVVGTLDGPSAVVGTFRTGPLPSDMPPIEVTSDPDRMAPGLTLFNQIYRPAPGEDGFDDVGYLTAVDETGEVVWYHREPLNVQDASRLDDGDLLVVSDETGARQFTPTGEVVAEWRGTSPGSPAEDVGAGLPAGGVIDVPIDSMHHDVQYTTDGAIVTLRRLEQEVAYDEPLCEDDDDFDGTETIVGDAVVLFDPVTGEVLEEHSLFDVLDPLDDPRRPEGDYCVSYLDRHYPDEDPRDWTHANAVTLSPDGSTWLVSNRHTDDLVALRAVDEPDGEAGSLRWRLGPDGDFELTDGLWFWHQHAPEWQDDDTILVYDNGNGRLDADDPYSRAVLYDIDEEAMTATQVWEHVMPNRLYASFLGDADMLDGPSGDNVLVTHGGQNDPCAPPNDEEQAIWGQVVEVERDSGEIVFDLTTEDLAGCVGWAIYRAERIPQIHPAGWTVEVVRR